MTSGVMRETMKNSELVSRTGPATITTKTAPRMARTRLPVTPRSSRFTTPRLASAPKARPQSPKASICQGVQGPCPKMKLLVSAESEPTRKPDEGPKAMPAIITMAAMGLKPGSQMNAARAATARAHMTASMTSSRAWGLRRSKPTKNGTMAQSTTITLTMT